MLAGWGCHRCPRVRRLIIYDSSTKAKLFAQLSTTVPQFGSQYHVLSHLGIWKQPKQSSDFSFREFGLSYHQQHFKLTRFESKTPYKLFHEFRLLGAQALFDFLVCGFRPILAYDEFLHLGLPSVPINENTLLCHTALSACLCLSVCSRLSVFLDRANHLQKT